MSRTYAARKLLEHGPLMFHEFVEITGWPPRACTAILISLRRQGIVRRRCNRQAYTVWRLA